MIAIWELYLATGLKPLKVGACSALTAAWWQKLPVPISTIVRALSATPECALMHIPKHEAKPSRRDGAKASHAMRSLHVQHDCNPGLSGLIGRRRVDDITNSKARLYACAVCLVKPQSAATACLKRDLTVPL